MEQVKVVDYLHLLAKDEVRLLNTLGSPVDSRMGMKVAELLGLLQVKGNEKTPKPRQRGNTPYPDVMCCKEASPPYHTWEISDLCTTIDEFNAVDDIVRRANVAVIPATIAEKASKVIRVVTKALESCKTDETVVQPCQTCGGYDHFTASSKQ